MKIQTILYYRYLMRQTMVLFFAYLLIALTICLIFLFVNPLGKMWSIIVSSIIWLLPLYTFIVLAIWLYKFIKYKKQVKNIELYERIKNAAIREKVLKSGKRIKFINPKPNQEKEFFQIIEPEIQKQKKLLEIQKGEFK